MRIVRVVTLFVVDNHEFNPGDILSHKSSYLPPHVEQWDVWKCLAGCSVIHYKGKDLTYTTVASTRHHTSGGIGWNMFANQIAGGLESHVITLVGEEREEQLAKLAFYELAK